MPIVVMHLRWDHLSPEQLTVARARLEGLGQREPVGACYSSRCRVTADALLATVVWDSEASARTFAQGLLSAPEADLTLPAPYTVAFGVPDLFAVGYRRAVPLVPAPRATTDGPAAPRTRPVQPRSL